MRLTELLTIYLAVGAPFGFARLFDAHFKMSFKLLVKAIGVALTWPVAALRFGFSLARDADEIAQHDDGEEATLDREQWRARREFEEALYRLGEILPVWENSVSRRSFDASFQALLMATEQHFHLWLALRRMSADVAPLPLALELCRLSGRAGDDLNIAANCIHRQNIARLKARCAKSANELTTALTHFQSAADDHALNALLNHAVNVAYRQAMLTLCCSAIELFSQLGDSVMATKTGRLLNTECAKLRRSEQTNQTEPEKGQHSLPANHSTFAPAP